MDKRATGHMNRSDMTAPTVVGLVDDQMVSAVAIVKDHLERAGMLADYDLIQLDVSHLMTPETFRLAFDRWLDEHVDIRLVLVDMLMGKLTGISAFLVLASRIEQGKTVPQAVGFCDATENRVLFKFAAHQMFPRDSSALVGWLDKSADSASEFIRLMREIRGAEPVGKSASLAECDNPELSDLMHDLLRASYDPYLWRYLVPGGYSLDAMALGASTGKSNVKLRLTQYRDAILKYQRYVAQRYAYVHPGPSLETAERVVTAFAATHAVFFNCLELDELSKRYQKHPRQRQRRKSGTSGWRRS
jgi:hypothetical protein